MGNADKRTCLIEKIGRTALHQAANDGSIGAVKGLVASGADVAATDQKIQTPLFPAAINGHRSVVELLLTEGANVNARDKNGCVPLHGAARKGDLGTIKLLVERGADIHCLTKDQRSVLHIAASFSGSPDAVKYFLDIGLAIDAMDENRRTPLFCAALNGHLSVVELLSNEGADMNARDKNGWVPLHGAARKGDLGTIKLLVERGADIHCLTKDVRNPLHIAAQFSGSPDAVKYFVDIGLELDLTYDDMEAALFSAALNGRRSAIELLLNEGADVNAQDKNGWMPLHRAAQSGDLGTIKLLVERGADIHCLTKNRRNPLQLAGSSDAVKYFLNSGLELVLKNGLKERSLFGAAMSGRRSDVEHLLNEGADINARDKKGWVPLHGAARKGDLGTIKLLVERGADIHCLTMDQRSALHIAASYIGSPDAVKYFLDSGLEVDAVDENKQTPLFAAAANGRDSAVELLLNQGADVNARDENGWLPLHGATRRGDLGTIQLLVERGADIHCLTKDGQASLHLAIKSESAAAIEFLIRRVHSVNQQELSIVDEEGWTLMHYAAFTGVVKTIRLLLDVGADIHKVDKDGWSAVHVAAYHGRVEAVKFLLDEGADINGKDKIGWSVLHAAAENGHVEVVNLLIGRGADMKATDEKNGWCMFHTAARGGSVELLECFLKFGADRNAVDKDGMNALHLACSEDKIEAVEYLVGLGMDVNAADNDGRTALHHVVKAGGSSCITYLLQAGATESIEHPDKDGYRPVHLATMGQFLQETAALLDAGADVHALTNGGKSPLQLAVFGAIGSSALSMTRVLCSFGADWTSKCQEQLMEMKTDVDLSEADSADERYQRLQWLSGLRACILLWEQQYRDGMKELIEVPEEVVQRGEASVRTYIADATSSSADELKYRCKVCVVGPSEWGKSSLVRSIETMKPFLMDVKDRTVGIELVPTALGDFVKELSEASGNEYVTSEAGAETGECETMATAGSSRRHEITFWDFAGQDVYQVVHSLFFSRRTLYVLVIDVRAYSKQLKKVQSMRSAAAEAAMDRFLSRYVFRWVRMIFARRTDAEFLVLGTKADLLKDEEKDSMEVWIDLQSRIYQWKLNYMREIEAEFGVVTKSSGEYTGRKPTTTHSKRGTTTKVGTETARIQELTDKLARLASDDWLVVSVTRADSIEKVRQVLQRTIESSELGFPMWNKYSRVLQAVSILRAKANDRPGDGLRRMELGMMLFRPLCQHLMDAVDGLEYDECRDILRTLHDLGDVIWYEREDSGELRDFIILDPMLVIDIVREVISHEHKKKSGGAIGNGSEAEEKPRIDGRVSHSLLVTFPLWKHMDKELMYAFKMLLKQFQLAYPADDEVMDPESDLVVPSYWKAQLEDSSGGREVSVPPVEQERGHVSRPNHYCWEYEVSADLADAIFEQFAVQSYTSFMKRAVRANCIESSCDEFQSWITLNPGTSKHDVIRVEVASEVAEIAWLNMRYYLMKLEKVLDGYTGLVVPRYIVVENKRHSLSPVTKAVRDSIMMGRDVDRLRAEMPWLPPDLDWFINHAWRDIGAFKELQMMHLVRDKLNVLQKLVVKGESQRRYPALWSLAYVAEKRVAVLRMLSDLSGRCYHVPIEIEVGDAFLAKHGSKIKEGISLLANIVPNSLSVPILQTAIDSAVSHLDAKSQRAAQIHNLIERMDITAASGDVIKSSKDCGLSPGGAMAVLVDLLKLHNDSLDELSITEVCNLECAATSKGEYVWAHAQEIRMLKSELTPCQPRFEAKSAPVSPSGTKSPTLAKSKPLLSLSLTVESVSGLANWDWYKTYCTWQLLFKGSETPLVSGATSINADSNAQPSWSSLKMALDAIDSAKMLAECRLVVQVKRRSRIGWTKLIGEGQVDLGTLIVNASDTMAFSCKPIEVKLQSSSSTNQVVHCQISAGN